MLSNILIVLAPKKVALWHPTEFYYLQVLFSCGYIYGKHMNPYTQGIITSPTLIFKSCSSAMFLIKELYVWTHTHRTLSIIILLVTFECCSGSWGLCNILSSFHLLCSIWLEEAWLFPLLYDLKHLGWFYASYHHRLVRKSQA